MALEITLYMQLSREIGLQLPILVRSPFLGISLIAALLNDGVKVPVTNICLE
jgi:hypothetical protein